MIKIICKILFYVSFSLCLADEETGSSLLKYEWEIDYEGKNKKIESISTDIEQGLSGIYRIQRLDSFSKERKYFKSDLS